MITNDYELATAIKQVWHLRRTIAALDRDVKPVDTERYLALLEQPLAEVMDLERQIGDYRGIPAGNRWREDDPWGEE